MLEEVMQFTKEHHMIEEGSRVIAGVSGGADSVCLLLLLLEMRREISFELRVIHVEHGIRGEESREDCAFVQALCEKKGVECRCFFVDVPQEAQRRKCTIEEAARTLRYEIFQREAKNWGGARIAVAHNREDDAETVLFHLARGSGLQGMCGILPVRENIIRPLLHTGRAEILKYLKEQGEGYRTDSTNDDIRYSRNKIRHRIMPELLEVNAQAALHIQRTADIMKEAVSYLKKQSEEAAKICIKKEKDGVLIAEKEFLLYDDIIQKEVLKNVLSNLASSSRNIGAVHLEDIKELFAKQCGRKIVLPYGLMAYRSYEGVGICREEPEAKGRNEEDDICREARGRQEEICFLKEELEQAGSAGVECGPFSMRLIENNGFLQEIPEKTYTKWFDYDMIKSNLLARTRREGDYFSYNERGDTQRLKKYFVNEKVEAKERDRIWLLAEGSHILWTVGYRISTHYKIQQDTKRILEVQFNGGRAND